jgi:hypothetical protein
MDKKIEAGEPNVELVTIRSFNNEVEAELARTELESAGIKSFLSGDDCGGLRPAMTFTNGIKMIVKAGDALRAGEILGDGS